MASMSAYLDLVTNKLHYFLRWLQTHESVDSIRMTNTAAREMHLSLRRYVCQQVCYPDAYAHPDAYATAGTSTSLDPCLSTPPFGYIDAILPGCRGLCAPFFGLETWPQSNDHWRRIDLSSLPDCALRDRNWVPITTPLARLAELRAEQGSPKRERVTASPLQRYLAVEERGDILPTSYRSFAPPPATDTGYASLSGAGCPRASSDDAYQSNGSPSSSSSTSYGRKRRRYAADISPRDSSSPDLDGPASRQRKRARRHPSFPYVVPASKRIVPRSMSAPSAFSATCVSHENSLEWEGMDVDADADVFQEVGSRWAGCSDETSSTSGSGVLDHGGAAAPEDGIDAKPVSTMWWGDDAAAADSPVEDHSPRPSGWLRVLWKLFDWRG